MNRILIKKTLAGFFRFFKIYLLCSLIGEERKPIFTTKCALKQTKPQNAPQMAGWPYGHHTEILLWAESNQKTPHVLFVHRSADDPGEATIAAGKGRRDSELLLHCGRSTAAPDTLAKERQKNLT